MAGDIRSLRLEVQGEVSESQELLDGTRHVVLEGSGGGAHTSWSLTLAMAWTMGEAAEIEEGDLTLTRDDGSELYGSLRAGRFLAAGEAGIDGAAESFEIDFEIDGGEGKFAVARGSVRLAGSFTHERFAGTAELRLPAGRQG